MRRLFRWFSRLLLLAFLLIGVAVLCRNPIVRELAERQIRQETGMEAVIGRVRIAIKSASVRIDNVRLFSPPEFGGQLFADLPGLYVEYDPIALLFRRLRFDRVLFRLDELRLVRNRQGETNLDALRERFRQRGWNERLARFHLTYEGTDIVGFSLGRLKYFDAADRSMHEETFVGVRGVTLRKPRTAQEVFDEMSRIARERGATNAAGALLETPLRSAL
jgi:hypothetical protein